MLGSSTRSTGPGTAAAWGSPAASAGCARGPSCSSRAPWPRVSPGGWQAMSSPIHTVLRAHRRRGLPGDLIRPAPPSRHRGGHRSGRRCLHCRPLRQPRGDRWMADRRRRHRRDESGAARRRRPGPRDAGGCTGDRRGRPCANSRAGVHAVDRRPHRRWRGPRRCEHRPAGTTAPPAGRGVRGRPQDQRTAPTRRGERRGPGRRPPRKSSPRPARPRRCFAS